jgi:hypothetical protein
MIDTTTRERLTVSDGGQAGPYIILPVELLDKVQALLDANQIRYWVDEDYYSIDGQPEITFVNIDEGTDPAAVQRLLDSVP